MSYSIKSIFPTLQGEGFHAGRAAVFVRFSGCNLWSGREETRHRDSWRHEVHCPTWCDTDFADGDKISADDIAATVAGHWAGKGEQRHRLIVLTGGEPLLQLDETLLVKLQCIADTVAIETNGTFPLDPTLVALKPWVTMSPKKPREKTLLSRCDEIKLVIPGQDPDNWDDFPAEHFFLQPCDPTAALAPNLDAELLVRVKRKGKAALIDLVKANPKWRLSLQMHKELGIP